MAVFCCGKCRQKGKSELRKTFWNRIIAFFDGALLILFVGALINFNDYKDRKEEGLDASMIASIIFIFLCLLDLVLVTWVLICRKDDLLKNDMKEKYGYLTSDFEPEKVPYFIVRFYPIMTRLRIIAVCIVLAVPPTYLFAQIVAILASTMIVLILLGAKAFISVGRDR